MKNSGQSRILILIVVFSMMSGCLDDGVEAMPDEVTGEEGIEKSSAGCAHPRSGQR